MINHINEYGHKITSIINPRHCRKCRLDMLKQLLEEYEIVWIEV